MKNHSPIESFRDGLLKQLVYFDENASYLLFGYSHPSDRNQVKGLLDRYCRQIERYLNGQSGEGPDTLVWIGSRVTVRNETDQVDESFIIVLPSHVDPDEGRISFLSPIGQRLLLSRIGYSAEIDSPGGKYWITVKQISYRG